MEPPPGVPDLDRREKPGSDRKRVPAGVSERWSNQVQTQIGTHDAATQSEAPDLQSQLEALLDAVWLGERWAKTEERIDAAVRYAPSGR